MSPSYATDFLEPGTLAPPGRVGRLVRLVFGLALWKLFFDLFRWEIWVDRGDTGLTSSQVPDEVGFWVLVGVLFWAFPHVVNIGFGVGWRNRPQLVLLGIAGLTAAAGLVTVGSAWTAALGWVLLVWLLYVSLHLGSSFVLAAILATPGCEMRAIPHLVSLAGPEDAAEHFCPGFLDGLDRWERRRRTEGAA